MQGALPTVLNVAACIYIYCRLGMNPEHVYDVPDDVLMNATMTSDATPNMSLKPSYRQQVTLLNKQVNINIYEQMDTPDVSMNPYELASDWHI